MGSGSGLRIAGAETLTLVDDGALVFEAVYVAIYTGLPFPDTADKLMANFQDLYEQMDVDEIRKLLHPDHLTFLQPSTTTWFPELGETLDIDEELRIHERMFSGQNVTDPLGSLVPAIQSIHFQTFARQGIWSTSPPNDPIPNTRGGTVRRGLPVRPRRPLLDDEDAGYDQVLRDPPRLPGR